MNIRAICFDFGNVIGYFDHRLTTERLAVYAGIPAEAVHACLFGGPLLDDYESGRLRTEEFLQRVRQACRLSCSDDVVRLAWADIFRPNPDVCALLPGLRPRYRLLLGSNTNELHARHFSRQFANTFCYFDALVFSHEVGVCKPRAAFFDHCCRFTGYTPAECLFIDDLPANVAGARHCGWHGIVYAGIDDLRRQLRELGIDSSPA
jgi:putative hydrolase of the HAD superfamily